MSSLSCGIVGLPNVGKSTLFNALTKVAAASENFPFCTIDPNIGIVDLPDERLNKLSDLSSSKKIIPASVTFVDIAGLVEGASKGEGLGNKFLSNIRETDAIIHVVRCFEDEDITHVTGKVDPISDVETIDTELCLADVEMISNALIKIERQAKSNPKLVPLVKLLTTIKETLNEGNPVRSMEFNEEELELLKPYNFLTGKRLLYVANVCENDLPSMENAHVKTLRTYAEKQGASIIPICAKLEQELAVLSGEDQELMLGEYGLAETGLNRLAKAAFDLLDLITYITTGEIETRAWMIHRGCLAPEAAGKIHSDIQNGFIRAEVVAYEDMIEYGGRSKARDIGKVRQEGKEYEVKDGDVILFRHN